MGVLVRWAHVAAMAVLVGVFVFLVGIARAAGRAAGPETNGWLVAVDAALVRLARWAVAVALGTGLLDLVRQLAIATGLPPLAALTPGSLGAVLAETRYGNVWLVRHATLLLLVPLLGLRGRLPDGGPEPGLDWVALRVEAGLLAALALGVGAAAGHAASAESEAGRAMGVHALHALASGAWLGALGPLAVALGQARRLAPAIEVVLVARAARRFSVLGLGAVGLLVVTGVYNGAAQVASYAALFGTPYGHRLLLKLAIMVPLLAVAALNLLVVRPALAVSGTVAHRAARRLRRHVLIEVVLGVLLLLVVAALSVTTPGRHAPIDWPFGVRLSWEVTRRLPGVTTRVAVGSQLAVLGLVATLLGAIVRRRHFGLVVLAGLVAMAAGLGIALPALAVDAYPTTYRRPTVAYAAGAIVEGSRVYRLHCARCHGESGRGDGPAAGELRPRPADLTAGHTGDHTAGDLFWWIAHGFPRSAMPPFRDQLTEDERWQVIGYIRALAAVERVGRLGPRPAGSPWVAAPDFTFGTGVGESRSLRDYRGRDVVLLVFFDLPGSLDRLAELGALYPSVRAAGGEILAAPVTPAPDLYRRLGSRPLVFPFVVEGAPEVAATYALLLRDTPAARAGGPGRPGLHAELLVDRQGYLRGRWSPGEPDGWDLPGRLGAEVERLAREAPVAPPPEEHVH